MTELMSCLLKATEALSLSLSREQLEQFNRYYNLMIDWNSRMNLTAITDPEGVAVKHFADSLLLTKAVSFPEGAKLADIGTGAGFPAVPVAVIRKDIHLILVDSLNKRISFLKELCATLEIQANCIHGRAEELGRTALREQVDVVTARAVAHLRVLAEYCLPFVKPGGFFVALKGPEIETELAEAERAIQVLGGELDENFRFTLPDGSRRTILRFKKISQTPTKYPRPSAKIAKSPLK